MLWPTTTSINAAGHLAIGGVDLTALAAEYGTPLYIYDEATIRERCRAFRAAFGGGEDAAIAYAGKTYLSPALLAIRTGAQALVIAEALTKAGYTATAMTG